MEWILVNREICSSNKFVLVKFLIDERTVEGNGKNCFWQLRGPNRWQGDALEFRLFTKNLFSFGFFGLTLTRPISLPLTCLLCRILRISAESSLIRQKIGTFLKQNDVIKGWLVWISIVFFSSISFVRISYETIWLKTWSWYKTYWKMKAGRAQIGIFQKMRIKNRWGASEVRFKKNSTSSPWKGRKTTSSATFCATGVWGLTS